MRRHKALGQEQHVFPIVLPKLKVIAKGHLKDLVGRLNCELFVKRVTFPTYDAVRSIFPFIAPGDILDSPRTAVDTKLNYKVFH